MIGLGPVRHHEDPPDDEIMRRWARINQDKDPLLYEEFLAYITWLRESMVHDSPTMRRMFLKEMRKI